MRTPLGRVSAGAAIAWDYVSISREPQGGEVGPLKCLSGANERRFRSPKSRRRSAADDAFALGAFVLANVVAAFPGRIAARTPTAVLLRSE